MKSILTLLKANIVHKKGAFKSIAALMAIITLSFSCTVSNNINIGRELADSMENTDVGDLLITLGEAELTDMVKSALDDNNAVLRWRADERTAVNGNVEINGSKTDTIIRLAKITDELRVFNEAENGFEENLSPKRGDVYISYSTAKISSFKKGTEIIIPTSSGDEVFTVAGFTEDPVFGSFSTGAMQLFIPAEDYDRISAGKTDPPDAPFRFMEKVYMLHVFGDRSISENELAAELNSSCGIIDKSMLYTTKSDLRDAVTIYSDIGTKLLGVFVFLLTMAVIITIHNSITTSIEMDYADLGVLKSQGFTTVQIQLAYILQYAAALLIGAAAGILVSIPLTSALSRLFMVMTGILTCGRAAVGSCLLIALAIAAVCSVFIVISAARVGRISPVKALSGGREDVYFSGRLNVKIRKKPLIFFIALRQLTSGIRKYIGSCIITALLVFFMISITVMAGGMSYEAFFGNLNTISISMMTFDNFETSDMDALKEDIKKEYDSADAFFITHYDVQAEDNIYSIAVTDNVGLQAKIYNGRSPVYSNEIAITEIIAGETGRGIGDSLTVHTDFGTEDYIITGFYQTTSEFGRTFIMDYAAAEKLGIPVQNGFISMDGCSEEDINAMLAMLEDKFGDKLIAEKYEMSASMNGMASTLETLLDIVVISVFSVSCVFAFLVVNMLCRKALLFEKRDIGIYKANGFSSSALRTQFSVRFLIIAIVGSIAGTLLSVFFTRPLFSAILRIVGITNFIGEAGFLSLFAPGGAICLCFLLFSYFSSRKVKSVETRELICE